MQSSSIQMDTKPINLGSSTSGSGKPKRALRSQSEQTPGAPGPATQKILTPQESNLPKPIKKSLDFVSNNKTMINISIHVTSAVVNFLTFLNANLNFINLDDETLVKVSNFFARFCTATRGVTGAADCNNKNNLIPLIGSVLEVPVAMYASGFLLWLIRGIPQSIRQVQGIIKNRDLTIKLPDGKEQIVQTDNFAQYGIGMIEGMQYSIREIGKIVSEFFTKPFNKDKIFFNLLLPSSIFQFGGPILAFFGLNKSGAFLRDLFGAIIDVAYICEPKKDSSKFSYLPAGVLWIGSAICDYAKRVGFIDEKISHLTQLSNAFDPLAGMFESLRNME